MCFFAFKNVNAYIQYSILILNKKTISKEELNNVFDKSKAQDGYIWEDVYTKEELIEKIKNIGEKVMPLKQLKKF
jgi:hypothetical protein